MLNYKRGLLQYILLLLVVVCGLLLTGCLDRSGEKVLVKSQQKRPKWLDQSMWEDIDNYYFMANETENTMTSLRVKIKCLDAAEDV